MCRVRTLAAPEIGLGGPSDSAFAKSRAKIERGRILQPQRTVGSKSRTRQFAHEPDAHAFFSGGAGTVTGTKHLLTQGQTRLLVDCSLFRGLKNLREFNWEPLSVDPRSIDAVVLTHAHLDHSGYLPKLVKDGCAGSIQSTPATGAVAELILKDSAHLQEKDTDLANRKEFSKHHLALPL